MNGGRCIIQTNSAPNFMQTTIPVLDRQDHYPVNVPPVLRRGRCGDLGTCQVYVIGV